MKSTLIQILHRRMMDHYPEKMLDLQQASTYTGFLTNMSDTLWTNWYLATEGQDITIALELVRESLIHTFGPSAFDYVETLICNQFPAWHQALVEGGIARYEIINILQLATGLFEQMPLTYESPPDPALTSAILNLIHAYRIPGYQLSISK